mgnify:CR=1 FL=1
MITYYPIDKKLSKSHCNLEDLLFTHSGKSSLSIILNFLRKKNYIINKASEVLMNKWIGNEVYKSVLNFSSFKTDLSKNLKVMICYHQYGYPQDLEKITSYCEDKKIFLIEDCAHVLESYYKDKKLGTFGEISFYSFSKFIYCGTLGGIKVNNQDLKDEFNLLYNEMLKNSYSILEKLHISQKYLYSISEKKNYKKIKNLLSISERAFYSLSDKMLKPSQKSKKILINYFNSEIEIRKKFKNILFSEIKNQDYFEPIYNDNVVPYAVPLFSSEEKLDKIKAKLRELDFECDIFHFDINRSLLSPNFKKCVLIPLSYASENNYFYLEKIINAINSIE